MKRDLPPEAHEEARRNPGGRVYQVEGDYGPDDFIPPEAVVGFWAVDDDGKIVGDFIPNPTHKPGYQSRLLRPANTLTPRKKKPPTKKPVDKHPRVHSYRLRLPGDKTFELN